MRVKDPSLMTGVEVPMAVETTFCMEGLSGETYLESNVMWFEAPESIIHALFKIGVEIFKTLPLLSIAITNVEAFLAISSSIFVSTIVAVEGFFGFFFEQL